jgi:phenylacetate-CoA ligase
MSEESIQMSFALWKRFHDSIGLPLHPKSIRFSGNQIIPLSRSNPPFWAYNKFEKRLFFSIYHLRKIFLPHYIQKLNEFQPELLDGYPSGIYVLANYILNNNIALSFVPKAICTTAEPLTPLIRERVELAFKCKVYNQYSSSEGGVFIAECTHSNLHVHLDSGYVEYINEEGKEGKEGEVCELVITGFRNFKTPLIRYKTGDWVELAKTPNVCNCGSKMPVVNKIIGRVEDYLLDEHGTEQGMVSYRTFKLASNIIKAQVIQNSKFEILIRIVKDLKYNQKDEQFISNKLHEILGQKMKLTFEYCSDIEAGANGKFKTVIKDF